MSSNESQNHLGLPPGADRAQVEAQYSTKRSHLNSKLTRAPTDALRGEYRRQLEQLADAYEQALADAGGGSSDLAQAEVRDLPSGKPRFGSGSGTGARSGSAGAGGEELAEGTILLERYEIQRRIGGGGMGVVYAAFDTNRDEEIAIKVLRSELAGDDQMRERFITEARLSSSLSHPRIVNVFDVILDADRAYLTMELLRGRSLRQEIEDRRLASQSFTVAEVRGFAMDLCDALSHAHEVTVHRDIKPENVWVDEGGQLKLMDFGIARAMSGNADGTADKTLGTACYMAPEQVRGDDGVDARTDQYALAILLFELLTFELPAGKSASVQSARKDTPRSFSKAIERALSGRPADRFRSVDEFAAALRSGKASGLRGIAVPAGVFAAVVVVALAVPASRNKLQGWLGAAPGEEEVAEVEDTGVPPEVRELRERWEAIAAAAGTDASGVEAGAADLLVRQGRGALDEGQDDVARESFTGALNAYQALIEEHEEREAADVAGEAILTSVDTALDQAGEAQTQAGLESGLEGGSAQVARQGAEAAFARGDAKQGQKLAAEAVEAAEEELRTALRTRAETALAAVEPLLQAREANRSLLEEQVAVLRSAEDGADREGAESFGELLEIDRRLAEGSLELRRAEADLAVLTALLESPEWGQAATPVRQLRASLDGDSGSVPGELCSSVEGSMEVFERLQPAEPAVVEPLPDTSVEGLVEVNGELIAYRRLNSKLIGDSVARNECWFHAQRLLRAELDRRGLPELKPSKRNAANPPGVAGPSSLAWKVKLP